MVIPIRLSRVGRRGSSTRKGGGGGRRERSSGNGQQRRDGGGLAVASHTVLASGVGRQNFPHPAQVASPRRCPTVGTGTSMNCISMN